MSPITVVTGTTHGIGRVAARELVRAGHEIVMLCRDVPAAEQLRAELQAHHAAARIAVVQCDLGDFDSVRAAAAAVRGRVARIDRLVNNAGMAAATFRRAPNGLDVNFVVNHLGPFLLTELLRDLVGPGGRIINVASRAHFRARLELAALADPRARCSATASYARSKLANVMHTFALARRLDGTGVKVNCLHPGVVATHLLPRWLRLIKPLISRRVVNAERGARTTLYLTLAPEAGALHGQYVDEFQCARPASPLAMDVTLQEDLWTASESWTGLQSAPTRRVRLPP